MIKGYAADVNDDEPVSRLSDLFSHELEQASSSASSNGDDMSLSRQCSYKSDSCGRMEVAECSYKSDSGGGIDHKIALDQMMLENVSSAVVCVHDSAECLDGD